jgi:hypothetical protein
VLLERLGRKHASKMYRDTQGKERKAYHIGYVIAGHWISLYEVVPFEVEV